MYVVKYSGPFGFIKPWTAVRDSETFSQQFLTPSIIEGMEKKLFPELLNKKGIHKIKRHRLNYQGLDVQKEVTWAKKRKVWKEKATWKSNKAIIDRGVMINPNLYLFFENESDADIAFQQTICLVRNEDLLFPEEKYYLSDEELDNIDGFELLFTNQDDGFKVGYNRYNDSQEMYGRLEVYGNPIRE